MARTRLCSVAHGADEIGMTRIQPGDVAELLSVRFELEALAWARLAQMFTDHDRARYEVLCRQELDLLSLA